MCPSSSFGSRLRWSGVSLIQKGNFVLICAIKSMAVCSSSGENVAETKFDITIYFINWNNIKTACFFRHLISGYTKVANYIQQTENQFIFSYVCWNGTTNIARKKWIFCLVQKIIIWKPTFVKPNKILTICDLVKTKKIDQLETVTRIDFFWKIRAKKRRTNLYFVRLLE